MYGKGREGAVSPGPVFMSTHQMTDYLQELRNNRPTRPTGSRPPPAHFNTWSSRSTGQTVETPTDARPATSHPDITDAAAISLLPRASNLSAHTPKAPDMSTGGHLKPAGQPLVQNPRGRGTWTSSTAQVRTLSMQYQEDGRRRAEREEVRALREAMEDLQSTSEQKIYEAAMEEAAELVWKHQNVNISEVGAGAPYPYPDQKKTTERSRSVSREEQDLHHKNPKLRKRRSLGSSKSRSRSSSLQSHRVISGSSVMGNGEPSTLRKEDDLDAQDLGKSMREDCQITSDCNTPQQRRTNSGSRRKASASIFKNPADQIYEEPEGYQEATAQPTVDNPPAPNKSSLGIRRNPFARIQFSKDNHLVRSNTDPMLTTKKFDRYEIQKNAPAQSRNAGYTSNALRPKTSDGAKSDAENDPKVRMKDGKEIRNDELRAATGFKLKDRSPKLPTPTMVSDSPGRPIVSFQKNPKANEIELKEEISSMRDSVSRPFDHSAQVPRPLSKASTAPVVPTLNTVEIPVEALRLDRAQVPTISVYEDPPSRPDSATTSKNTDAPLHSTPSASRFRPSPGHPKILKIANQGTPAPSLHGSNQVLSVKSPTGSVTPSIPTISVTNSPTPQRGPKIGAPSSSVALPLPMISISEPSAPTQSEHGDVPSISVTPSVPTISINGPSQSPRPLPIPSKSEPPFLPTTRTNSRSHWTPTNIRSGALCEHCALPIAGRIVSAAGARFHSECFLCHHCGEHLECVAFYPEPGNSRDDRLDRIRARQRGEDLPLLPTHPTLQDMQRLEAEDGDESMRFYCHLDFHEMFSPRCKSCKTPIEGEVVVACGAEWHPGHFFCAHCGDPFDSSTPFVEKDGYAWCVDCHTNRFSTKCRKCRKPVTDTVVKALGAEWHVGCFCCVECSGPFEDGRYFLRGDSQDPVCVKCEERRLKA